MKLRINGNILIQLFKLAGGNPITMNNSEVYQAGQRGILDGGQVAIAGYLSNAWYEVFKYMSDWPLGASGLAVIMNKDSWNKLVRRYRVRSCPPGSRPKKPSLPVSTRMLKDRKNSC